MVEKEALLVGVHYPGQGPNELYGCCNDARRMLTVLTLYFGFKEANIDVLVDDVPDGEQPTHVNILKYLNKLIRDVRPGVTLVFFFAGHGDRDAILPEAGHHDEHDNTGYDEAILPTDGTNPLTDDDFREIICKIPEGVKFAFISDSCCSRGLIDDLKEQIGTAELQKQDSDLQQPCACPRGKQRKLSSDMLVNLLNNDPRINYHVESGNIRTAIYDLHRDNASLTIRSFQNLVWTQLKQGEDEAGLVGTVSELSIKVMQAKLQEDPDNYLAPCQGAGVYRPRPQRAAAKSDDAGILLSGCQSSEFSRETTDSLNRTCGVFTKAIEKVLQNQSGKPPLTNRQMTHELRKEIASEYWKEAADEGADDRVDVPQEPDKQPFPQYPCLYCSDKNADEVFICDFVQG